MLHGDRVHRIHLRVVALSTLIHIISRVMETTVVTVAGGHLLPSLSLVFSHSHNVIWKSQLRMPVATRGTSGGREMWEGRCIYGMNTF